MRDFVAKEILHRNQQHANKRNGVINVIEGYDVEEFNDVIVPRKKHSAPGFERYDS
jgi:hypothetical protein